MRGSRLEAIVEAEDATAAQRRIGLVTPARWPSIENVVAALKRLRPNNAKGEHDLTHRSPARRARRNWQPWWSRARPTRCSALIRAPSWRRRGCGQRRLCGAAMENGATLIDPKTTFLAWT